jgi:hypothetical protein
MEALGAALGTTLRDRIKDAIRREVCRPHVAHALDLRGAANWCTIRQIVITNGRTFGLSGARWNLSAACLNRNCED